jgi:hypothetical protein
MTTRARALRPILFTALLLAFLAGCGENPPAASTPSTTPASGSPQPTLATTASVVGTTSSTTAPITPGATRWDWLPTAGYDGEALVIALRVGPDAAHWRACRAPDNSEPTAGPVPDVPLTVADGVLTLDLVPGPPVPALSPANRDHVIFMAMAPATPAVDLHLVRPGAAQPLALDALGRLTAAGAPAILVLPRLEADGDRRWQTLRWFSSQPTIRCALTLTAPRVPPGQSDLLALIAAAHATDPAGRDVLIVLGPGDRLVGWNHRAYRQALAWLVADLAARGAGHLVIAGPYAPAADADRIAPLIAQVDDIGTAYRCRTIPLTTLAPAANWEIAPGILGPQLNPTGAAALHTLLAPWLP